MEGLLSPTKDDWKSILKREHRIRQEKIRKERILNPRQRLIGIDKAALDQLVEEKQRQNVHRQQEEIYFSMEQNRLSKMIDFKLKEARSEQLKIHSEMNDFRNRFQQKEHSREFDLNDPLYLHKMTASDKFHWVGLDPDYMHRKKIQQEQQKSWLNQQIMEKFETNRNTSNADKAVGTYVLNQDVQMRENENIKHIERRKNQLNTAIFNQALAQANEKKRLEDRRHEQEDNLAEVINNLCSDMLTEKKESGICQSLFGGSRITPTMNYRGMNDDQLLLIRSEQLKQIQENRSKQLKQKEEDLHFDEITKNRLNSIEIEAQEAQNKRNQSLALQNTINMELMSHQKLQKHYLNEKVYKFTPAEEFFDQFNTTSR